MTDFQAVAPPVSISTDGKAAFADAVQRAKQIAAKIGGASVPAGQAGDPLGGGLKRPLEDFSGEEPDRKKNMAFQSMNDPLNSMFSMKPVMPGVGGNITEDYKVPSSLVGLIIGRGGETITKIQSESGCKVQVAAQNDVDNPEVRTCTLTGSTDALQRAKAELNSIVYNSKEAVTEQLLIKANKVGLIIGKKGETIRKMMEESGAKMMMIQDSTINTGLEKPLKITGDQNQVDKAKEMIQELLDKQQEYDNNSGGMQRPQPNYGAGGSESREFTVPRLTVGIIIGKKGDMIRSIQEDTGARVQFNDDDGSDVRVCIVTGSLPAVERARTIIDSIVMEAEQRDMERGMGGMRGRGRGRGGGPNNFGNRGGGFMGGMMRDNHFQGGRGGGEMREMPVAFNKCGLIIGRGGANIQAIKGKSGARIEMTQRLNQEGDKIFTIQGTPEQIESAEQLIREKLSEPSMGRGGPGGGGRGGYNQNGGQGGNQGFNGGGGWGNNSYGGGGGGGGGDGGSGWGQQQPQQQQPQQGQDQSKSHEAAWQAFYQQQQQYYPQPGQGIQPQAAVASQPQPSAAGTQQTPTQSQAGQSSTTAAGQQDFSSQWADYYKQQAAVGQAQTGQAQPDYSAAWAEYFRQQQMMYANQNPAAAGQAAGQPGQQPNQSAGYPQ
ncbi:far upstream element-binding protein 1-like isoform X1 [Asterias rubens]|uniref:far upstream element-binding protein 1-like isoform X1 n=1 Tax=Asterias rubens TaxID=7604 RepID=UPI0014558824|nr:far upstream element-binding protein 1-like isoform X1 [Asterias rubens]